MTHARQHHLTGLGLRGILLLTSAATPARVAAQDCPRLGALFDTVSTGRTRALTDAPPVQTRPAQTRVDPFAALPPSDGVATVDMARVFNEALLTNEPTLLAAVNEAVAGLKEFMGLDARRVERIVYGSVYVKPHTTPGKPESLGVWIVQTGEPAQLSAHVRRPGQLNFREESYGGKTLYVARPAEATRGAAPAASTSAGAGVAEAAMAVAALDANTLVFGDLSRVRASLDASTSKGPRVSAELVAAATRDPKALFGVATLLPNPYMPTFTPQEQAEGGELIRAVSSLKQFSTSVTPTSAGYRLTAAAAAAGPEQAETLAEAFGAFKTFVSLGPAKLARDRMLRDALKALAISVDGSEVRISGEFTQANAAPLTKQLLADYYFRRGLAYKGQGNLDAALAAYERAIALDPESTAAHVNRGTTLSAMGDLAGAIADFDRAVALDPGDATAYNNRSFNKLKLGDFDGALADAEKAIALDPRLAYAYNNRGFALVKKGRLDEALADYDKSIALDPTNALAYASRGFARYLRDDLDAAVADLNKAVSLNPGLGEAYLYRGLVRTDAGDPDGAIADFDKVISIDPASAAALNGRGLARYYKEDFASAISDFGKAIAADPKLAHAYGNRALSLLSLGRDTEAAKDFATCFKLDGTLRPAFEAVAKEIKQARRGKARPRARRALSN